MSGREWVHRLTSLAVLSQLENVLRQIPLQRERMARASGLGEGFHKSFFNVFRFCTPHPVLRTTLSRRERGPQTLTSESETAPHFVYASGTFGEPRDIVEGLDF
jgi:hypothetical protein